MYITKSSEQGAQTQIFLSASKTINPKRDSGDWLNAQLVKGREGKEMERREGEGIREEM